MADHPSETERWNRVIANWLDRAINGDRRGPDRPNGFVLLTFPIGTEDGRRTNYVSNCERSDMLVALKEIVARFEGRAVDHGTRQ